MVGADPELLAVARRCLRPRGWEIEAGAGARGDLDATLAAACKAPPDVVLVELGLPGIAGLTFVNKARSVPALAKVPIILTGARNLDHEAILTDAVGAVAHLSRPYEAGKIEAAIDLAMGGVFGA